MFAQFDDGIAPDAVFMMNKFNQAEWRRVPLKFDSLAQQAHFRATATDEFIIEIIEQPMATGNMPEIRDLLDQIEWLHESGRLNTILSGKNTNFRLHRLLQEASYLYYAGGKYALELLFNYFVDRINETLELCFDTTYMFEPCIVHEVRFLRVILPHIDINSCFRGGRYRRVSYANHLLQRRPYSREEKHKAIKICIDFGLIINEDRHSDNAAMLAYARKRHDAVRKALYKDLSKALIEPLIDFIEKYV